jgi:hypothetical protein
MQPDSHLPSSMIKATNEAGFSALLSAITTAKQNARWTRTIQRLVEHYTIEELEQNISDIGSYLHITVANDSVVGARVLLENGVNVEQPSFNVLKCTPLQMFMTSAGPEAMFHLLIEYGVNIQARSITGASPYLDRLTSLQRSTRALDVTFNDTQNASTDAETLHTMLFHVVNEGVGSRNDGREVFKYLLRSRRFVPHLNTTNERGVTLIHLQKVVGR